MVHVDLTSAVGPRAAQLSRCPAELLTTSAWTASTGAVVVAVRGELDMSTCTVVRDRIAEQLRFTHHLVLDLSGVDFLCAAGLTVLVVVREMAQRMGAKLCVVARNRPVRLPLVVTGLSEVLDLHLDIDEALACEHAGPPVSPAGPRLADPRQPGDLR